MTNPGTVSQQPGQQWSYWTPSTIPSDYSTLTSPGVGGTPDSVSSGLSTGSAPPSYMSDVNNPTLTPPVIENGVVTIPQQVNRDEAQYSLTLMLNDPNISSTDLQAINQALVTGDRSQLTPSQAALLSGLDQEVHDNQTFQQTLLTYIENNVPPGTSNDQIIKDYNQALSAYYSGNQGFSDDAMPDLGGMKISTVLTNVQALASQAPPTPVEQVGPVTFDALSQTAQMNNLQTLLTEKTSMIQEAITLTSDKSMLDLLNLIANAVSNAVSFLNSQVSLNQKNAGLFSKADLQATQDKLAHQAYELQKEQEALAKIAAQEKKMKILKDVMIGVAALMIACTAGTMTGAVVALTVFALITVDQQCNNSAVMNKMFGGLDEAADKIAGALGDVLAKAGLGNANTLKKEIDGPLKFMLMVAVIAAASYFGGGSALAVALGPVLENGGMAQDITNFWKSVDPNPIFDAVMTSISILAIALMCGNLTTAEKTLADEAKGTDDAVDNAGDASKTSGTGKTGTTGTVAHSDATNLSQITNPLAKLRALLNKAMDDSDAFFADLLKTLKKVEANITKGAKAEGGKADNASVDVKSADESSSTPIQDSMVGAKNSLMFLAMLLQGACQVESAIITINTDKSRLIAQQSAGSITAESAYVDEVHKVFTATINGLLNSIGSSKNADGSDSGLVSDLQMAEQLFQKALSSQNLNGLWHA